MDSHIFRSRRRSSRLAGPPAPTRRRTPSASVPGSARAAAAVCARISSGLAAIAAALPSSSRHQGRPAAAAEAETADDSRTALVSVAAYSLFFGWWFAVGFVILLFVHEMGHVIQLRREGIKASAPMFIPFMGAVIFAKSFGDNALSEARVGLAGPDARHARLAASAC